MPIVRNPSHRAGYGSFSNADVERLRFIKKPQELGFSLAEIRDLALLRNRNSGACTHAKAFLKEKLGTVRWKLRELEALEKNLRRALRNCEGSLKRRHAGSGKRCSVLVKLGPRE